MYRYFFSIAFNFSRLLDNSKLFAVKILVRREVLFMPRRGENIYKRKDGRWEGRYIKQHIGGKAKYGYIYAKTYKELKEKMNRIDFVFTK